MADVMSDERLKALESLEDAVGVFLRVTAGQIAPSGAGAWSELHGSYIVSRETR